MKFIRFGQWRIERTGQGILGFITNHSYLDNPTFRGMRQSLMKTFTDIYILNLHGSVKKRETARDGGKDENVFDIQQGVAISLFVKQPVAVGQPGAAVHPLEVGQVPSPVPMPSPVANLDAGQVPSSVGSVGQMPPSVPPRAVQTGTSGQTGASALPRARVHYAEVWGLREAKYGILSETDITSTDWQELKPNSPFYLFVPQKEELRAEYDQGWKVTDIFSTNSVGIVTARDNLTIRLSTQEVWDVVRDFSALPAEVARDKYNLGSDVRDWKVSLAQKDLKDTGLRPEWITTVLYRPFDIRHTYYTGRSRGFICMPRPEVMRHMLAGGNAALLLNRQIKGLFRHVLVAKRLVDFHVFETAHAAPYVFPLYLYPSEQEVVSGLYSADDRRPNLNPKFVAELCGKLRLPLPSWREGQTGLGRAGTRHVQGGQRNLNIGQAEEPVLPVKAVQPVEQPPSAVQDLRAPPAIQRGAHMGSSLSITRRHLPHWQLGGSTYFITFRTRKGVTLSSEERAVVLQSCLYGHPKSWRLHAAIIMPDHAHLLLSPEEAEPSKWVSLSEIMKSIKGATAHRINKLRGRTGSVWQNESFDRIIRDESEFTTKWNYICENAMKAGLSETGLDYPFFWHEGEDEPQVTPEDIFNYAYAVFHSPTYRTRYAEFLRIDFPRLPLTSDRQLFRALAGKGGQLVALHLLEARSLEDLRFQIKYDVQGSNLVERVTYDEEQHRVYINQTQFFEGIEPDVWQFHVGGYQVLEKWLKDRRGRTLGHDDIVHYQKVVISIQETIRLMNEIDTLIPSWPLE